MKSISSKLFGFAVTFSIALFMMGMGAHPAVADTIYQLNVDNGGISPSASSYGTITLSMNGPAIQLTLSAAPGYYLGGHFGFNVSSGSSGIAVDGGTSALTASQNISTFGVFDYMYDFGSDSADRFTSKTINITRSSPSSFSDVSGLADTSSLGYYFAIHVFPSAVDGSTGFAASTGTSVPEPSSLLLLGAGLSALGLLTRCSKN